MLWSHFWIRRGTENYELAFATEIDAIPFYPFPRPLQECLASICCKSGAAAEGRSQTAEQSASRGPRVRVRAEGSDRCILAGSFLMFF